MATRPQQTPYHSNRIGEGWHLFLVPRRLAYRQALTLDQAIRHQGDERKQGQDNRGRPRDRQVTPLPLRLHPEMRPRFFKRHFHPPAPDKPPQDLLRRVADLGREKGLRLKLALW